MEVEAVSELLGIARFTFHEGKVDDFKRLSEQCMEIVRTKDNGTLQYDIYFNDDESEAIAIERYRDSEALIEHLAHLGDDLMAAMMATASVHGETLGEPSRPPPSDDGRHSGALVHAFPVSLEHGRRRTLAHAHRLRVRFHVSGWRRYDAFAA
jgi:quinol monooxygenase YgiN